MLEPDNKSKDLRVLNKTHNTKIGIVSGLGNKFVTLFMPFIVRTFFIKYIGIEYAGLTSLYSSILQVLNLAELGFSSAVVYSMYKPIAERDDATVNALLAFYKKIYLVIGLIIIVLGLAILPFLDLFISEEPPKDANLYIIFLVFLLNTSLSYLLYGYKVSLLNANQRTDVINNVGTITTLGVTIAQIIILFLIPNYYVYVLLMPVGTIVHNLIISYSVDKMYPQYHCEGVISDTLKKDVWKKVTGLMIQKVCVVSRNTIQNILISAYLSLTIVAIYNNYYMILMAILGILWLIPTSMLGGIGNKVQTDTVEENYHNMQMFNCLYMWISTISAACLLCLFQPFMELWMGKDNMFSFSTVVLLVVYYYILKMGDIRSLWVDAVGLYWEIRWRAILEVITNIVLDIVFIRIWGINGLLVGTILSLLFVNFFYGGSIPFKYYFGSKKLLSYFMTQFLHFFIMSVSCISCLFVSRWCENLLGISNLLILMILRLSICIVLPNLFLYLLLNRTMDFNLARQWVAGKIRR